MLTIFCQKSTKFCIVRTLWFYSNFTSMWSKYTNQIILINNSISNGKIKCPIGKSILAANLPLKLFRATVAYADIGSLKSLHTFLKNVCTIYKWNLNKIVLSKLHEIRRFLTKKPVFFLQPFLTKSWRHFGRRFGKWNYFLMLTFNLKTIIFQCSKNYGTPTLVT